MGHCFVGKFARKASEQDGFKPQFVFVQHCNSQPNCESWVPRGIRSCHNNQQTIISQRVEEKGPKEQMEKGAAL